MSRAIPVMTSNTQRIAGISMVSCGSGPTRPAPHRHQALASVDMVGVWSSMMVTAAAVVAIKGMEAAVGEAMEEAMGVAMEEAMEEAIITDQADHTVTGLIDHIGLTDPPMAGSTQNIHRVALKSL